MPLLPYPARARVAGGDEKKSSRQCRGRTRPAYADDPLLQWLAECIEDARGKFAELVEEKDPTVGEGDLPWAQQTTSSAYHGHHRRAVVRSAQWRMTDIATRRQRHPRSGVNTSYLLSLRQPKGRKKPYKAARQHCLARPGRPNKQ